MRILCCDNVYGTESQHLKEAFSLRGNARGVRGGLRSHHRRKKLSRKFPAADTGLVRPDSGEGCGSNMGNGVCSRRQRRIFQSLLLITVVCGMIYGGMISYEMHKQLKRTEAMALKYQQHQESLSAQLQGKHTVVGM